MKKMVVFLAVLMVFAFSCDTFARDVYVRSHVRKDGTYVQPSYRTTPDNSRHNNYSTKGNVNPYTGKKGTVDPFPAYGKSQNRSKRTNNNF